MSEESRNANRVDYETKVHLEFEKFSGFITEYSTNISKGGMFIKSDEPLPMGSVLSFEFRLKDDFHLIQGLGEVVWVRSTTISDEKVSGMGIKFREISEQSLELIESMTQNLLKSGQTLFDLSSPPEDVEFDPDKENVFEDISDISFAQIDTQNNAPKESSDHLGSLLDSIEVEEDPSIPALDTSGNRNQADENVRSDLQSLFDLPEDSDSDEATDTQQDSLLQTNTFDLELSSAGDEESMQQSASSLTPDETFHLNESFEDQDDTGISSNKRSKKGLFAAVGVLAMLGIVSLLGVLGFSPFSEWLPFGSDNALEMTREDPQSKDPSIWDKADNKPDEDAQPSDLTQSESSKTDLPDDEEKMTEPSDVASETVTTEPESRIKTEENAVDLTQKSEDTEKKAEVPVALAKKDPVVEEKVVNNTPKSITYPPARTIEGFSWEKQGTSLIAKIKGDGAFDPAQTKKIHLRSGNPREVLIVSGVTQEGNNQKHNINANGLIRARSGLHLEKSPSEVHYVFDLSDPLMEIKSISAEGKELIVTFSK